MAAMAGMSTACGISQQQEVQLGAQQAQQVNAQLPIVQDPVVNRYLNILGDSLAHVTSRSDLDWHFYMVNTSDFNIMKVSYGKHIGDPGYDERADFNGDEYVNASDFVLVKVNFGQGGAAPRP